MFMRTIQILNSKLQIKFVYGAVFQILVKAFVFHSI